MSSDIIRPEKNIPPRENAKEYENILMPDEVSKKKSRTLSSFGDISNKEEDEIILDVEPSQKEQTLIEDIPDKENKQEELIKDSDDREVKDEISISETESQRKEDVPIKDADDREIKEGSEIKDQDHESKDEIRIPEIDDREIKEGPEIKDQEHENKQDEVVFTDKEHENKSDETVFTDKEHEEKSEEAIDDPADGENKSEDIVLRDEDHEEKSEERIDDPQARDEKSEIDLQQKEVESEKVEESVIGEIPRDEKGESEIRPSDDREEKSEIGLTKDGSDYNLKTHERLGKIEVEGYQPGQPDINTRDIDSPEALMQQDELSEERPGKTENGPAPVQVDQERPQDQEDENLHFNEVSSPDASIKNDGYNFVEPDSTHTENINYNHEYSLRVEQTNQKDSNNWSSTFPEVGIEPMKSYRKISSMQDASNITQHQSLFEYDIHGPENRFPDDPKETNTPYSSAESTNNEKVDYGENGIKSNRQDDLDLSRVSKLSDGTSEGGDYLEDKQTAILQTQYENVNSTLENLSETQSTKNYSYDEVMREVLNSMSTERLVEQPSSQDYYNSISSLDETTESLEARNKSVNNSTGLNEVGDRVNRKIADDFIGINGVDNTSQQVAAHAQETDESYGQINRGSYSQDSEDKLTDPESAKMTFMKEGSEQHSDYQSPIEVEGSNIRIEHDLSPKVTDEAPLPRVDNAISSPFLDNTSIEKPEEEVDRLNNPNVDNIHAAALDPNTVHKYSPKVGQREGDDPQRNSAEFSSSDILAGPSEWMRSSLDYMQNRNEPSVSIPYEIDKDIEPTNTDTSISHGTISPRVDIRLPILSLLTHSQSSGGSQVGMSILQRAVEGATEPMANHIASQANRYQDATINDNFANIATRQILTDGMRFAYSRMHNAVLQGPTTIGGTAENILSQDLDETTPTGAGATAIIKAADTFLRIPQRVNQDDTLRRGFIPSTMNKYINKSAGVVYDNMTSYINSLREHITSPLSLGLSQPDGTSIEEIDVRKQKEIAESRVWSEELQQLNRTIVSMLSPMEYKDFGDAGVIRKKTGYNIDDHRENEAESSDLDWRRFNRNRKPSTSEDLDYGQGSWLAPQGENNLIWKNNQVGRQYTERIRSYREAGFENATEMAANDFRVEWLFFDQGRTIESFFDNDINISSIEEDEEKTKKYTNVETSQDMYNVYRTAGTRRNIPKGDADQKQYSEITIKEGTDHDAHAIEIENAQIITGAKDDFYNEMSQTRDYYSMGKVLDNDDNNHNIMFIKDFIHNHPEDVDNYLSNISSVQWTSDSVETYLDSLNSANRNIISYGDNDDPPIDQNVHTLEPTRAEYNPNQGKDLFARATHFTTFGQSRYQDFSIIDTLENFLSRSESDDSDAIEAKKAISPTINRKNDLLYDSLARRESSFRYSESDSENTPPENIDRHLYEILSAERVNEGKDAFINHIDSEENFHYTRQSIGNETASLLHNLSSSRNLQGELSPIINLNKGTSDSRPTISEGNDVLLVGDKYTIKTDENVVDEHSRTDNPNVNISETITQGVNLLDASLQRGNQKVDLSRDVEYKQAISEDLGPTTALTAEENNSLLNDRDNEKRNIDLSYTYTTNEDGTISVDRDRVLGEGDRTTERKNTVITTINSNKVGSRTWADAPRGGVGYIMVSTKHGHSYADVDSDSYVYTIPFQFNAEITGESRTANWSSQQAFGRTNEVHMWSNTSSRSAQFKTSLAILYGEDEGDREVNPIYDWGQYWTEQRVLETINKYRMLVLPISGRSDDPRALGSDPIAPPIITLVRSPLEQTWANDDITRRGDRYARWIVTDISIDPREEVGFTKNRTPRVYDISLTLKEIFNSPHSYQYIRGMKHDLGIPNF